MAQEETKQEEVSTEEAVEATETAATTEAEDQKKSKKKEKEKKNKDKERIAELEDQVMRQMAEFDNFRKRTEREKSGMFDSGCRSIIEKILPIVDNFERGFAGMSEEQLKEPFPAGMMMVYKQLLTEFEKMDVKAIPAVGEQFNPNLHEAVMHIDDDQFGSNEIVEEFQKGYTHHDTVIRHSMVKVAN